MQKLILLATVLVALLVIVSVSNYITMCYMKDMLYYINFY